MTVIKAAMRPGLLGGRLFLLVSIGAGAVLAAIAAALAATLPVGEAVTTLLVAVVFLLISGTGWAVEHRVPGNAVGRLLALSGLLLLLSATAERYARHGVLTQGDPLPGSPAVALVGVVAFGLAPLAFLLSLATFPDGRTVGSRLRRVLEVTALGYVACGLVSMLHGGHIEGILTGEAAPSNPLAVPSWDTAWTAAATIGAAVAAPVLAVCALASLVVRYRRASGDERLQVMWVLLATGLAVVALPLDPVLGADGILFVAGLLSLPLAIGTAMVRWRLYAVDRIANRTLVYAGGSALAAAAFIVGVSVSNAVLSKRAPVAVSALAAGLVALSLLPVYVRLQRMVNRFTFGSPDDPRLVLRSLGRLLEGGRSADDLMPDLADRLARDLRLGFVAIDVNRTGGPVREAQRGVPTPVTTTLALLHKGHPVGSLVVAGASGHELRPDTRATLEALAPQLAATLAAVSLERELNRSRDRLLVEREQERRRIQRDLHDGLGPLLASIGIQADLARRATRPGGDPEPVLRALREQSAEGVAEVRRIVRGLSPAPLERLGLDGALVEQARVLSGPVTAVQVRVPQPLPPLSPAARLAAYQIAAEAMSNAVRHAHGSCVVTTLTWDDDLLVEVTDDGCGISAAATLGVGLVSMTERASEVGGSCAVEQAADGRGTRVRARLPLDAP